MGITSTRIANTSAATSKQQGIAGVTRPSALVRSQVRVRPLPARPRDLRLHSGLIVYELTGLSSTVGYYSNGSMLLKAIKEGFSPIVIGASMIAYSFGKEERRG